MKLSYRVWPLRYKKESEFQQLLEFLTEHKACIDEISLFTEYWHHGYYPLDQFQDLSNMLKDRVIRLKQHGFDQVGINMLDTIGHLDEAWDVLPALPFQKMVGHDGTVSRSVICPNDPSFQVYIQDKYKLIAEASPDFIWVDDDTRLFYHPSVFFACFCPICVSLFNRNYEVNYSKDALVDRLNDAEGGELRVQWVEHNTATITSLMRIIARAVYAVNDQIELGLMTTGKDWTTYNGDRYDQWMGELEAVKGRPGSGFFEDPMPIQLVYKALGIVGRQAAAYPAHVTDIQYELESFPFQKLGKSIRAAMAESTASLLNGANGIIFDILKQEEGSLADYHDLMKRIKQYRPFWEALVSRAKDMHSVGFYPALSSMYEARRSVTDGKWFAFPGGDKINQPYALSELGLPYTFKEDRACGIVLHGTMPMGYTKAELIHMLSSGVLLDGKALEVLWEMGLGEYCGVAIAKTYDNGVLEQFTADVLNGGHSGEQRDGRLSYSNDNAYVLQPLEAGVRVLSELISYTAENLGSVFTIYENVLGGRVAVQGYMPWKHIHSSAKRWQLLSVCDWLSGGTLPVFIRQCVKVVPFVKVSADGKRGIIALLNTSLDETGPLDIEVRFPTASVAHWHELTISGLNVQLEQGSQVRNEADKTILKIPTIQPWEFRVLGFTEEK